MTPKILAFAGSSRRESFNRKLVAIAASGAEDAGGSVTVVNLRDYPMPIYDGYLEEEKGMPQTARDFKLLLVEHDGFLIASPEYNSGFSALLKNTIDWASRAESDDEPPLVAFRGKTAAIMAASPGGLGGIRGLVGLRMLLQNIGVIVLPDQRTISSAYKAFAEDGSLSNSRDQNAVRKLGADLVALVGKLKG